MNPYLKECLVGVGVFVATLIVSALTTIPFGDNLSLGYGIAAVVMFGLTFLLARALRVETFTEGMFRGSVWLIVSLVGFILMSVVGDQASLLSETTVFVMLACLAGGPMLAGRLAENAASGGSGR